MRRLLLMLPVAFFASLILFVLLKLTPGDPVRIQLGEQVTAENYQALRRELGLDQPAPVQYVKWLSRVARGDFGKSLRNRAPVRDEIAERMPKTLLLGGAALLITVCVAFPFGTLAAIFRRSPIGFLATAFTQVGVSLPNFLVALLLIYVVSARWGLVPPGAHPLSRDPPREALRLLLWPPLTLSLFAAPTQTGFIRTGMLEVLQQDYIRTARAKGLSEWAVITRHALRNALIPSVTLLGLQVGTILEGAFITEQVFAWPGMGRLAVQAIGARDYPIVQAVVLIAVFAFMFANLIVDIAYAYLDPRISYARR